MSDNTVIALPAEYGPEPPPKTDATVVHSQGDTIAYYQEDDSIIQQYF